MKKYIYKSVFITFLFCSVYSCSPEDASSIQSLAVKASNLTAITTNDLVGQWKLTKMRADTLIDLNQDGAGHTNLLRESSCFDTMNIIFNADGTFTTHNSKLDFNGGTTGDQFTCANGRDDFGTWSVSSNMLTLNINIDGTVYSQQKKLTYNTTTFSFKVTKQESKAYVSDPGNTSASPITILSLGYTKN